MALWHRGQRDPPITTDCPSGSRWTTTFKKLPINDQKTKTQVAMSTATPTIGTISDRGSA